MIDHVSLISCFKALIAVTRERTLILDVVDNHHGRDAQRALLHVGVILAGLAAVNVANLDLKHGNDRAEQVLNESFLLADQQQLGLQLGQCDVDRVDLQRHCVCDDPPLVRRHLVGPLVLGVFQERVAIRLVEVQQAAQVHPGIRLLWAFDVHGNDQVVLRVQVDRECVGLFNPDAVVDAFGCRLDHNVDLMRCAPDAQHIIVDAIDEASDYTSMTTHHGVLVSC